MWGEWLLALPSTATGSRRVRPVVSLKSAVGTYFVIVSLSEAALCGLVDEQLMTCHAVRVAAKRRASFCFLGTWVPALTVSPDPALGATIIIHHMREHQPRSICSDLPVFVPSGTSPQVRSSTGTYRHQFIHTFDLPVGSSPSHLGLPTRNSGSIYCQVIMQKEGKFYNPCKRLP